jgi:hypothetical protein
MMLDARPCFLCGNTVLGLAGQDIVLDTFLLRPGKRDDEVLAEEAFGPCHLKCLIGSRWASFWSERVSQNYTFVRKLRAVHRSDEVSVFRNRLIAETVVVRSNGWIGSFTDAELKVAETVPEGQLVPVSMQAAWDVTADRDLHAAIETAMAAQKPFSLFEYVSRLGLADRLWFAEAIRRGRIVRGTASNEDPAGSAGVAGSSISVELSYYKLLPADIAPLVMGASR